MRFLPPLLFLVLLVLTCLLSSQPRAESVPPRNASRLVTIGGAVTETVFALGRGGSVVGVDDSSLFPEAALSLPRVGYSRSVSAEGILSLRPSLVLACDDMGPPAALQQLRDAEVEVRMLPTEPHAEGARRRIREVAALLGVPAAGDSLVARLDRELRASTEAGRSLPAPPRVLFVYSRGPTVLQVSGEGTAAAEMIRLAGGVNAVSGFQGYRPLTPEAAVLASPDVILMTSRGLEGLGGVAAVQQHPGLSITPAGRAGRVIAVDDLLLLGFGPRLGEGVGSLATLLRNVSGGRRR